MDLGEEGGEVDVAGGKGREVDGSGGRGKGDR